MQQVVGVTKKSLRFHNLRNLKNRFFKTLHRIFIAIFERHKNNGGEIQAKLGDIQLCAIAFDNTCIF